MAQNKGQQLPPGFKAAIEAFANAPDIRSLTIPTIDLSDFAKAHANALAVFPEMQRHVVEHSKDIENLQKQLANIRFPPDEVIQQLAETAKRMESVFANLPRPSGHRNSTASYIGEPTERTMAVPQRLRQV